MEVSQFFSSTESAPYTMGCEGDVHCVVTFWWGNTAPHCTSKADGKCCLLLLLLHIPAAPPSSSAQEKTMTLGGTEPHHSSWQCKESHRCFCHEPLAPLAMEDSGTSTILTSKLMPCDLFRSFVVCSGAKESGVRKITGSYRTYSFPGKTAALVSKLRWKTFLRQNFSLGSCACSEEPAFGQNTLMMMMMIFHCIIVCKT